MPPCHHYHHQEQQLTCNRLKDSDVTWLYGPLHTAKVEPVRPLKISSTEDRVGLDLPANVKPGILKHRTLTELLSLPAPTSPELEGMGEDEDDFIPTRLGLPHTKSESNLQRSNSMPARRRPPPHGSGLVRAGSVRTASSTRSKESSPDAPHNNRRHITFNTFVEQCIALDEPNLVPPPMVDDSEDDDMIEMRSPLSRFSSGRRSSSISSTQSHSSMTIKMVAPTVLKTAGSYTNNANVPQTVHRPPPEYMSQEEQQQAAATVVGTSPFDIPSPLGAVGTNRSWHTSVEEDEYASSPGFDYFGGPDLTGASPKVGTYGRAPAVQPPPAQPKWRQAQTVDVGSAGSTSSSSSSLNTGIPAGAQSPQPPSRGILKVRAAPAVTQQVPEPVSPPAIFNYNPSVATGIGGMYGTYENAQLAIGTSSPAAAERSQRGRSTSRGYGSSQYDRSVPRASSASSSASSVGSVSRSPVEGSNAKAAPRSQLLDKVVQDSHANNYSNDAGEPMDVDASPDRSSTPTPHSSPQVCRT